MEDFFKRFENMISRMQKIMDDAVEDFGRPRQVRLLHEEGGMLPSGYRKPYLDIIENENEIIAKVDMPGLKKDEIHINLANNRLEISADINEEKEGSEEGYIYKERRKEKYYRSVLLPSGIDPDNSKAEYENGVLEIKMPKTETTKKRSLKVE